MLDKWLENKYPKVLERYKNDKDLPPGMYLGSWLEIFEIDLYNQYVEEIIKPVRVFEALLCGEKISDTDYQYQLDLDGHICIVDGKNLVKAIFVQEMYFGDFDFIEFVELTKDIKLTQL